MNHGSELTGLQGDTKKFYCMSVNVKLLTRMPVAGTSKLVCAHIIVGELFKKT